MSDLPVLASTQSLQVVQQKEMLEVFTNFETKNRYIVQLPTGQPALYAAETGGGAGTVLLRTFLKAKRPFTMALMDTVGQPALQLQRPWTWFFSKMHVTDGGGMPVGTIQQRWAFFARRFDVLDHNGQLVAQLHGPFFRPWTFRVVAQGHDIGKISKKWSGLLKEAFTDADTFGVEFSPAMPPPLRSLVLAATFLIDFLYFEDKS
jgi:uncharacterized protein YxjI